MTAASIWTAHGPASAARSLRCARSWSTSTPWRSRSPAGAVADQQARHGAFAYELTIDPSADGVRDDLVIALARELLTNAAKHADASCVRVSVRRVAEAIELEVADDGSGIPEGRLAAALREGHIGLASSVQRVEAVGGTLTVAPVPGGGTSISVTLPG
jgi:two-component system NarL family sensor kinase